jgi:hypothetical protein
MTVMRACVTCGRPSPEGYCEQHRPKPWSTSRRRVGLSGSSEQKRRRRILRRHLGRCHVCGGPGADEVDHVVSLAEGGADSEDDLRARVAALGSGRSGAGASHRRFEAGDLLLRRTLRGCVVRPPELPSLVGRSLCVSGRIRARFRSCLKRLPTVGALSRTGADVRRSPAAWAVQKRHCNDSFGLSTRCSRAESARGVGVGPIQLETLDRPGGSLVFCTGSTPCPRGAI